MLEVLREGDIAAHIGAEELQRRAGMGHAGIRHARRGERQTWGTAGMRRAGYPVILRLMRRIIAKAAAISSGANPFSSRCWRRRTTILRELNRARPLSVRKTSTK